MRLVIDKGQMVKMNVAMGMNPEIAVLVANAIEDLANILVWKHTLPILRGDAPAGDPAIAAHKELDTILERLDVAYRESSLKARTQARKGPGSLEAIIGILKLEAAKL